MNYYLNFLKECLRTWLEICLVYSYLHGEGDGIYKSEQTLFYYALPKSSSNMYRSLQVLHKYESITFIIFSDACMCVMNIFPAQINLIKNINAWLIFW